MQCDVNGYIVLLSSNGAILAFQAGAMDQSAYFGGVSHGVTKASATIDANDTIEISFGGDNWSVGVDISGYVEKYLLASSDAVALNGGFDEYGRRNLGHGYEFVRIIDRDPDKWS